MNWGELGRTPYGLAKVGEAAMMRVHQSVLSVHIFEGSRIVNGSHE